MALLRTSLLLLLALPVHEALEASGWRLSFDGPPPDQFVVAYLFKRPLRPVDGGRHLMALLRTSLLLLTCS
jgi:hypothetical protein